MRIQVNVRRNELTLLRVAKEILNFEKWYTLLCLLSAIELYLVSGVGQCCNSFFYLA